MTGPAITRPPLRDTLLEALGDAIETRRAETGFCPACRQAPDGLCGPQHRDDSAAADDYEAAREALQRENGTSGTGFTRRLFRAVSRRAAYTPSREASEFAYWLAGRGAR